MYMLPYRCKVTGKTGNAAVAPAIPPTWCENDSSTCTKGPRQMIYWNQLEGNNILVSGFDRSGDRKSPAYNAKLGFSNGLFFLLFFVVYYEMLTKLFWYGLGAQTDIFGSAGSGAPSVRLGTWHAHLCTLFFSFSIGCFVSLALAFVVS